MNIVATFDVLTHPLRSFHRSENIQMRF